MAQKVYLPVHMVTEPGLLPPVCPRHLRAVVRRRKVALVSPPRWWFYALIPAGGLLLAALIWVATRRTARTEHWPVCADCLTRRRVLGRVALGTIATMAALPVLWPEPAVVLVELLGVIGLVVVFGYRNWGTLIAAGLTQDGGSVVLHRAHPGYVATLPPVPPGYAPVAQLGEPSFSFPLPTRQFGDLPPMSPIEYPERP